MATAPAQFDKTVEDLYDYLFFAALLLVVFADFFPDFFRAFVVPPDFFPPFLVAIASSFRTEILENRDGGYVNAILVSMIFYLSSCVIFCCNILNETCDEVSPLRDTTLHHVQPAIRN